MAPSTTNTSTKVHPPSISSNTRSMSPAAPTNPSQPPAPSDPTTFRYTQFDNTTPVAGGDPIADLNRLSDRNLNPIRSTVTLPDLSSLPVTAPKKS